MALLHLPDLMWKGLGAHSKAIPLAVLSVYRGVSCRNGATPSGSSNSSSSSGNGSVPCNTKQADCQEEAEISKARTVLNFLFFHQT